MTKPEKLLTIKEICNPGGIIPISRTAFLRGIKEGIYPKPTYFGKLIRWKECDILELREKGTRI